MKVNDYVRTKSGLIGKIMGSNAYDENKIAILIDDTKDIKITPVIDKEQIIKSSPNIIDLIERFDLVNGHLVICKMYEDEKDIPTIIKCVGDYYFKEEDIKSIVTKEQFDSMEYKVGD